MTASPDDFESEIQNILAAAHARVVRFEFDGEPYWIKRPERPSLRMRLQKGNSLKNFNAERAALHHLNAQGIAFSTVVAEGAAYFVTKDGGAPLMQILQQKTLTKDERCQAFGSAGRELALMHNKGFSHGRPSIKDICWKDGQITLLDLEYYSEKGNSAKGHKRDLLLFLLSAFAAVEEECAEISAAIAAYRAHDTTGVWNNARHWCKGKWWADPLTKPLQMLSTRHVREFRAIPLIFNAFEVD